MALSKGSIYLRRNRNSDFHEWRTMIYGVIKGDVSFASSSAQAQHLMSNNTLRDIDKLLNNTGRRWGGGGKSERERLKTSIYSEKSTTVTGPIFMKLTLARQYFVKTSCTKFRGNPISDLVADSWSHAARRASDVIGLSVCLYRRPNATHTK